MKRITALIIFFLLVLQNANAEPALEWEEGATFLYGMSIYQADGESLAKPAVDMDVLNDGLLIRIENGMPYFDRGLLLFILDGRIQAFSIGDEKMYFSGFAIDANTAIEVKVRFDELYMSSDEADKFLHVVQIGLLDRIPSDEYDYNDVYTNVCSIPIVPKKGKAIVEASDDELELTPVSSRIYEDVMENGGIICFSEKMDEEHIYIRNCIEEGALPYQLQVTAVDEPQKLSILLLADGEPWQPEKPLCSGYALSGHALQKTYTFSNFQPGDHQICAIMIPMNESITLPIATPQMLLRISDEENE